MLNKFKPRKESTKPADKPVLGTVTDCNKQMKKDWVNFTMNNNGKGDYILRLQVYLTIISYLNLLFLKFHNYFNLFL